MKTEEIEKHDLAFELFKALPHFANLSLEDCHVMLEKLKKANKTTFKLLSPLTTDTVSDEEIGELADNCLENSDISTIDYFNTDSSNAGKLRRSIIDSLAELRSRLSLVEPVTVVTECPNCKSNHNETDCQGFCTASCLQESEGNLHSESFISHPSKDKVEAVEFAEWTMDNCVRFSTGLWQHGTDYATKLTTDELYSIFKQSKTK